MGETNEEHIRSDMEAGVEKPELPVVICGEAFYDIRRLGRELALDNISLIQFALRLFADAVEAGIVSKDSLEGFKSDDLMPYEKSWVRAFRLYCAVNSIESLDKIAQIIIVSSSGKRRGIDWRKDFREFSKSGW